MKMQFLPKKGYKFVEHLEVGDREVCGCIDLVSDEGPDGLRYCLVVDDTQVRDMVTETPVPVPMMPAPRGEPS